MSYCIIFSTAGSQEEAEKITNLLLESRAASCVQITPVQSFYHWKGKIEQANEMRLVIKTTEQLYLKAERIIKEAHSYDVPEIVKVPITAGLPEYLDWISAETG